MKTHNKATLGEWQTNPELLVLEAQYLYCYVHENGSWIYYNLSGENIKFELDKYKEMIGKVYFSKLYPPTNKG